MQYTISTLFLLLINILNDEPVQGLLYIFVTMKSILSFIVLTFLFLSCTKKKHVDLLVKGGHIISVDSLMTVAEVMVIENGKIIDLGNAALTDQYIADSVIDLNGAFVFPGLVDAHAHFYGLGMNAFQVDLTNTKSWNEVIERCKSFYQLHKPSVLLGRGWDQNDWANTAFPDAEDLNAAFPNTPVLLKRIDGHAAIANEAAMALINNQNFQQVNGGEMIRKNGKLTGLLIDEAVTLVEKKLPKTSRNDQIRYLKYAEQECLKHGLTLVCDAGLDTDIILLIDSLHQSRDLKIRLNTMVSLTDQQLAYWLKRGVLITDRLHTSSFKMYADGALGSRGACLTQPYSDRHEHFGIIVTPLKKMEAYVAALANSSFQLNTHCIGDSANRYILQLYGKYLGAQNPKRWRIEHAQVVHPNDMKFFGMFSIVPSVQPTHATSDMYWAEKRIGKARLTGAYALKTLLHENGWLPLGTDFPVEKVSPFHTFYAAVARTDSSGYPEGGFMMQEALTRIEALKGITYWAAKACNQEAQVGSLSIGKQADFIILDKNLLQDDLIQIRNSLPKAVFIAGQRVK